MKQALEIRTPSAPWPADAAETVDRLLREVVELRRENTQLRTALDSRIVIEQAKGILAERFCLIPEQAFDALRRAARSHSRKIHDVAREVVESTQTPPAVAREVQQRAMGGGSSR